MSQKNSSASNIRDIFPFLDLPREIQDLIYKKYYEDAALTIGFDYPNDLHDCSKDIPVFRGIPSSNIEFLNRQIRQDAINPKTASLPRTVKIEGNTVVPRLIEGFLSKPRFSWILDHIEEFFIVTEGEQFDDSEYWNSFVPKFPHMKRIYLQHREVYECETQDIYDDFVRRFKEGEEAHARHVTDDNMDREFAINRLRNFLNWNGREEVRVGVLHQEVGHLAGTDHSYSLITKGTFSKERVWNVSCEMIDGDHKIEWDGALPQGAVTYEFRSNYAE